MSFSDYMKNKKNKTKQAEAEAVPTAATTPTFSQWMAAKKETSSVEGWLNSVSSFLGDVQTRYQGYNNSRADYDTTYGRSRELLAAADTWRKQYAGNEGAVKSINQAVDMLGQAQEYAKGYYDFYSQWATSDEYDVWKRNRENVSGALSAADFEQMSAYKSTVTDRAIIGQKYADKQYEFINAKTEEERKRFLSNFERSDLGQSGLAGEPEFYARGLDLMEEQEIKVYNYLYATQGPEAAEAYLDSLSDTLLARKSGKQYESLGSDFEKYLFGIQAGFDQFSSGIRNAGAFAFGTDDVFTPASQYTSAQVREELSGKGFKVLGSSVGQIGYDALNTTANMLPSIFISMIPGIGSTAGVAAMGLSASGNAYTEMKRLGYDNITSRNYAALVGVSEAVLQKVLGGISSLGGASEGIFQKIASKILPKVDRAFARVALELGANMADEGLEEAIQSVLEPIFLRLTTGEPFEGIDWEEVAYSGLLGALSAGMLEGAPAVAGTAYNSIRSKKYYGADQAALLEEALELNPGNKYVQGLKAKADSGKTLSGMELSRLVEMNEERIAQAEEAVTPEAKDVTPEEREPEKALEAVAPATPAEASAQEAKAATVEQSATAEEKAAEAKYEAPKATEAAPTTDTRAALTEASKKYGRQAEAMAALYREGQDVESYDRAFRLAYDMGASGVSLSYAMESDVTAYLTEEQRKLAHQIGAEESSAKAGEQDAANRSRANGKTGRRKGTVKGEGVTISDLKASFNDTQGVAYRILTTYAEATGIDIVLYKSEANAEGRFEGAQGKFKWNEDTIYIDVNAGLSGIKSVSDLAKYTMLRTFAHEFTHFIEKWNPVQYNEFRRAVFDTMTERGENVDNLIRLKLELDESGKMTYELASREVLAEAMTDVLPDANFVEQLAENHKGIFNKLLDMLREFVADLKAYFDTVQRGRASVRESKALMEQVDGTVKYLDSIVALFDRVAVEAVEAYQATVAEDVAEEAAPVAAEPAVEAESPKAEEVVTPEAPAPVEAVEAAEKAPAPEPEAEATPEASGDAFVITDNAEFGTLEIKFDGKPSEAVRNALKANKFRWHGKKGVWYGKAERADIIRALREAYKAEEAPAVEEAAPAVENVAETPVSDTSTTQNRDIIEKAPSDFEKAFWSATDAERDEVIEAMNAQNKMTRMMPTEKPAVIEETTVIEETAPAEEVEAAIAPATEAELEAKNKAFDKKFGALDKSKWRFASMPLPSNVKFILDGALGIRATEDEILTGQYKYMKGRNELSSFGYLPANVVESLKNASQLITDAPVEIKYNSKALLAFTIDGANYFFNKKYVSALDGATFYMGDFGKNKILKAVDESGEIVGMILPVMMPKSFQITESKPVRLKSFSAKKATKTNTTQEVTSNGKDADHEGAVQQPDVRGSGDSRVLDEVEARDVQGDAPRGDALGDAEERGRETVRNGGEPGERTGDGSRHGDGSGEVADLRRDGGLTSFEEAKQYAADLGYRIELNKLAAKKHIVQVDIYDKQGLPTFSPVVLGELGKDADPGAWNLVKEAIDAREAKETDVDDALHAAVADEIEERSTEHPKGRNFVIGDSLDLPSGEKARYKANVDAIRLVKQLEAEGRHATDAEQVILSKYVGWGGLANAFDRRKADWAKEYAELSELLTKEEYESARGSTLNAHYTDISVIKAMYDGLASMGFTGGRMLEPSAGVGNFVGAMPPAMSATVKSWTMVELDGITGLIAKHLYPNADVRIQGFEKANIPDNYMDVVISNVPFGNYAIADKAYPKRVTDAIHNYFFAKSLDKVRPGGIVMFITSAYTMNAKDSAVRKYIMGKADLLGAIRLPNTAFKGNAGTEVVTDILVLKKRPANTPYAGEAFLDSDFQYISGYNGANINEYFTTHPEMALGTPSMDGGMYRSGSLTYNPFTDRGSLADQIREAFSHIKGKMDYPAQMSRERTNLAVERASKKTKENGLVVKDGKVFRNEGGQLVEQTVSKGEAERVSGMLGIRDAARDLLNYQLQGLTDAEIKKARGKLNKAYDDFVQKYGYLNARANKSAMAEDPDSYSLLALENWDPDTKKATKADVFSKNTISPNRTVNSAKDVSEGLIVSVNQTGGVDAALIAKLTGKTEADVTRELIDGRKVFKNRDGVLESAEVYLSGNVRAKLRDAEALVPIDGDYKNNVEALKAVIPADVGYQDIFVNPGTPWIPNKVYSDFAAYMLGGYNTDWRQDVDVTRNPETGNFTVELKGKNLKYNASNTQKWGTSRRSFLDLFDAMLNSKSVVVKDRLSDGSTVINKDETAAANEKMENIQKEFQDWLWRDEGRRGELATLYNEVFNSVVTPKYNGDNLTVNGANAMKPLRPHQRNAVQRVISSGGNTLLAHKVGAGKTYEMAASAMKLKELGLVKKPMFVVPKSLVAQWGVEFKDFFPMAKLLVTEASDFTTANRKVFMNRIANGEYDAVIVSYEQFEKLPVSDDFARGLYQEQIDSIVAAIEEAKAEKGDRALSIKDLEKKRKSLQTKIDKLTDKAKDVDNIDFEQLGVDSLFVDEAHNFKNLFYTTSMTNVSGLGNKDGSKRAFDLYTKVRYLQQLNGGRGIVFATATPVMNSMSEMYIMQKYLQPDLLDQLGLSTFDAWAKQFGEVVNGVEIKPSGQGYRMKQSFSRFKNMSELQLLFRNFADVLTDIPGLKIPKMKGGKVNVVVCDPGQFQQEYMKELEERADKIKNVDPSVDNMLKITSDGRKISYTQRMIDPSLPYEESCKLFRCADNVVAEYKESKAGKGTQLVFLDMATPKGKSKAEATAEDSEFDMDTESAQLYDDLKARLMAGGIPAKEIAFIHDADTDQKKKKLFADVNDGKVRVLIGSTGKMGVGMNAQKRVVAIHHLDAPWRPGDVEQRNGRAFRQGNVNEEVSCYTYVTEGSFDARLWDILERKQNFINQVMNGESVGREAEDTGEVTLSAAEVKALASGSPLIMEQVQLDTDIKKLESLYRAHASAVRAAKEKLSADQGKIATLETAIKDGQEDMATRKNTYTEENFSITIGRRAYTDKKEAGVALMAEATAKANEQGYTKIATFAGFDLQVIKTTEGIKGIVQGRQVYPFNTYPTNTTMMVTRLMAVVENIDSVVQVWQRNLAETRADMAEQEKLISEPFAKQSELDAKRARYNEVMAILNPKEEQALDSMDEETVQEQSREYLSDFADNVPVKLDEPGENYGLSLREYSLSEIFTMFYRGNSLGVEYDVLFDRVYDVCKDAGITFEVLDTIKNDKNEIVPGVSTGIRISLNQESFNDASLSNERKSMIILHEMIHAATTYAVRAYDKIRKGDNTVHMRDDMYNSCAQIVRVFESIQNNPDFEGQYGKTRITEMVAELSNPTFVSLLKMSYPSMWHEFVDFVCRLFGINKRFNNYSMLKKAVDNILSNPDYALASKHYKQVQLNESRHYLDESQYYDARDAAYMKAVESGNMEAAQRMVDEAADRAMPNSILREGAAINKGEEAEGTLIKMFHGSGSKGFYEFTSNDGMLGKGVYVTSNWDEAVGYAIERLGIEETEDGGYLWGGEEFDGIGSIGEALEAQGYVRAFYADVTDPNDVSASAVYWEDVIALVRDGSMLKSADPVTYDDNGNVIPVSRRFNAETGDVRYQQRTNTLTDREVLTMAAERLEGTPNLTEGERDALRIFQKRLETLQTLTEERADQGRLYKEQQFGAKVDRAAAAETLNRMHVLDDKIKAANEDVLSVENKEVLRRVLVKARGVVEEQERIHGKEILDRWRDRTRNAAAIKKYRTRIEADVKTLSDWILKPDGKNALKHVPDVLKNTVIPFLTSIDFTSKRQLNGGEATKADTAFVERLEKLQRSLFNGDLSALYAEYDLPPYFDSKLAAMIDSVKAITKNGTGEYVINRMTAEELKELSSVIRVLKSAIVNANKFHANAMFQHVDEAGGNTVSDLSSMASNNGKANGVSNFVFWRQIRPAYAFERFGEGGKAIYDGLRRGQAKLAFNTEKIVEFSKSAYSPEEVKGWENQVLDVKLSDNTVVKIKVSQAMAFYELYKQADSKTHILGGGIRVSTYTVKGEKISDGGHVITEADAAKIISELTPRQKEVADKLQRFMADQGAAWGNYVSVARFGEEMFTNEQYFPINSDGQLLPSTADKSPESASLYALLNMSFTKSRQEGANNRIVLYSIFDVFSNHMASMAQYNAMALPVLDAVKWFNYRQKDPMTGHVSTGVRDQMIRVYGVPEEKGARGGRMGYAEAFVLNILKSFNGTDAQGAQTDNMGVTTLRRYNMAQIAYNFRVVVQQPLSILRAGLLLDFASIIRGFRLSPKAISANVQEMKQHSGIAAWKALGFYDVNVSRGLTDIIKNESKTMDKIREFGMLGAEKMDEVTWAAIWSACKEEVARKKSLKLGSDEFFNAVTQLFEDVIYKTQVVDSILTKNEFMRSKGFWARAVGSFMSEPSTTASMVVNAYDKYNLDRKRGMDSHEAWNKNKAMIGRTLYVYAISQATLAAVTAVIDALRDDDDYEEFYEKWLDAFAGNAIDELLPFNKLPILADFYDLAKEILSVLGVDTYGNPPQSVFMQWYDSLIKGTEILHDKITGEDTNYTWYSGIYKMLQAVSGMVGMPAASATREIVTAWNNTVGAMAPSLKVKTYDAGDLSEIKFSYLDGHLTAEEATALILEKGLADDENEAYFIISGWDAGEGYSRYDDLYDAVLNGGDFEAAMNDLVSHGYKRDEVISKLQSQIGRWYYDDASDVRITKQRAEELLDKYTDLSGAEITKVVNRWSSKVVTGTAYNDIADEFLSGKITANRAIEMYSRYGSMTREEAKQKVEVLSFIKKHPDCEDITYAALESYNKYCEPAGISATEFYTVWKHSSTVKADVDKNGNAVPNSKKAKMLKYINSLRLTKRQKDALYRAFGWSESGLSSAPWH